MIARLRSLFTSADSPEMAVLWSRERWLAWFAQANYAYFGQADLSRKRAAFAPFSVEPLSDVAPATQLNSEVKRYASEVVGNFAAAVDNQLYRWRAEDGREIAVFSLQLYDLLGSLVLPSDWETRIITFISRLGPPLTDKDSLRLLDAVVNAAVGRADVEALRRFGEAVSRRTPFLEERPWRAQIRLFEGLLEIEGFAHFDENVRSTLPDICSIVHRTAAKHLLADVIVERLGLPEVAELHGRVGNTFDQEEQLKAIRFAIFPGRVEFRGDYAVDRLTGYKLRIAPEAPSAAWTAKAREFSLTNA
jgi:hypothetical protein